MIQLLGGILNWISRWLKFFILILLILVVASQFRIHVQEWGRLNGEINKLNNIRPDLGNYLGDLENNTRQRINNLRTKTADQAQARIQAIDDELRQKQTVQTMLGFDISLLQPLKNGFVESLRRHAAIEMLKREKEILQYVKSHLDAKEELERRRQQHVSAYAKVREIESERRKNDPAKYCKGWRMLFGLTDLSKACKANREAYKRFKQQKDFIASLGIPQEVALHKVKNQLLSLIDANLAKRNESLQNNSLDKFIGPVKEWAPTAFQIAILAVVMPGVFRIFSFHVLAPIVTRLRPIRLLPDLSITSVENVESRDKEDQTQSAKISSVSLSITVDNGHELLVLPEYLQSVTVSDTKRTQLWLEGLALTSLAAGLVGLTRIRPRMAETYVISSTQDPLIEIGLITIPEGGAFAFRSRSIVGVVKRRDRPLKISRKWQLGSLHAWLTLQLRYLVFHGPALLIVKGCRGIRVEKAGKGHAINHEATLGFSANLDYGLIRCETFMPYLWGQETLYKDMFAGQHGYYVYEEIPFRGRNPGYIWLGRGLDGIFDAILKVFGI